MSKKLKQRSALSYLGYSGGLHLFIVWLLVGMPIPFIRGCSGGGEEGKQGMSSGEAREIVDIEQIDPDVQAEDPKKKCEPYFGGIGVTFASDLKIVNVVHKGYVAERIGIRVGDEIITQNVVGPVGTPLLLKIRRNGQVLEFSIVRDRICVEDVFRP